MSFEKFFKKFFKKGVAIYPVFSGLYERRLFFLIRVARTRMKRTVDGPEDLAGSTRGFDCLSFAHCSDADLLRLTRRISCWVCCPAISQDFLNVGAKPECGTTMPFALFSLV